MPLSKANQEKAQRKIAVNAAVVMVMYLLSTVSATWVNAGQTLTAIPTSSNLTLWVAQIPIYIAILGTLAAFVWPLYLAVIEERKTTEAPLSALE